jgi:hypothetical protein
MLAAEPVLPREVEREGARCVRLLRQAVLLGPGLTLGFGNPVDWCSPGLDRPRFATICSARRCLPYA